MMQRTIAPQPASTILFEGDSLTGFRSRPCLDTWAWQRLTGAHYGYPERVGDWVFCNRPDLNLSCRNGAIGGSIMGDVLERFETITKPLMPGVVVMTIGSNDATRRIPLDTFRDQAERYCSQLQALSGGRVIYLGNIGAPAAASEEQRLHRQAGMPYSHAMAAIVTAHGGLAVDLGSVLLRRSETLVKLYASHSMYHDGTHFNPVGYEVIANVVLRALGLIAIPGDPDEPTLISAG